MEIGTKVKHIPTGDIIQIKSKTKVFIKGKVQEDTPNWMWDKEVKVRISECEVYVDPPKEKSFYDQMRERNMEEAKKLSPSPKDIGQHILWLKMAVVDRVEKIEKLIGDEIYTFRKKENDDDWGKFGFSENYVNLLMHYAYEAGKQNATESLTRSFTEKTNQMKHAIDGIINALDSNNLLPDNNDYY